MTIGYLIAIILAALAATRLPSAARGRNLPVMLSAAAIVVAFILITPAVYSFAEKLVPLPNFPDLIAKLLLFLGVLLAGTQVARAFEAPKTERLVSGVPGLLVFLMVLLADVVIFGIVHVDIPSPDLSAALDNPLVRLYSTIATAYPAYVAALLIPHLRKGLSSSQRSTRATSVLLIAGFTLALTRFVIGIITLTFPGAFYAGQIVSGLSAIAVAAGLATAWLSRVIRDHQVRRSYE